MHPLQERFKKGTAFKATKVSTNLYVGDFLDIQDADDLRARNIWRIVNMAAEIPVPSSITMAISEEVQLGVTRPCLRYMHVPVEDDPSVQIIDVAREEGVFDFIRDGLSKNEGTIVNCYAGVSRSVTVVVAYLMMYGYMSGQQIESRTLLEVLTRLACNRPSIKPNYGFMNQLKELDVAHGNTGQCRF